MPWRTHRFHGRARGNSAQSHGGSCPPGPLHTRNAQAQAQAHWPAAYVRWWMARVCTRDTEPQLVLAVLGAQAAGECVGEAGAKQEMAARGRARAAGREGSVVGRKRCAWMQRHRGQPRGDQATGLVASPQIAQKLCGGRCNWAITGQVITGPRPPAAPRRDHARYIYTWVRT